MLKLLSCLLILCSFLVSCSVFDSKVRYDLFPEELLNKDILRMFEDGTLTLAAEIHYWRIPHTTWRDRLIEIRDAEISTVST